MATHTDRGQGMYFSGSERVSSAMAFWIMPTWGPFPWAMMTSCPSSIRSTMALAVCFTAIICSGRLLPRALPPSAITIRLPMKNTSICLDSIHFGAKTAMMPRVAGVPLRRLSWPPVKMMEPVRTDTGRLTYADGPPEWKRDVRRKACKIQRVLRRLTSGTNGRSRAPPEPSAWPEDPSP